MIKIPFLMGVLLVPLFVTHTYEIKEIKIGKPDLVIGSEGLEEEGENYIFGDIADISLDENENIYILDSKI